METMYCFTKSFASPVGKKTSWLFSKVMALISKEENKSSINRWIVITEFSQHVLVEKGVAITQANNDGKRYFVGDSTISLEVRENNDWFDVYAIVRFGTYEIPFIQLKKYIQAKKKEFVLPNGEIAVIPEEWFTKYSELFAFVEDRDGQILLQKHHLLW